MIKFIINDSWACSLDTTLRYLKGQHPNGMELSCHLSQPEARILQLLLKNSGSAQTREDLTKYAWGGRPVTNSSLNHAIFNLRQPFGSKDGRTIIVTVPGKGYMIQAQVEEIDEPDEALESDQSAATCEEVARSSLALLQPQARQRLARQLPLRPTAIMGLSLALAIGLKLYFEEHSSHTLQQLIYSHVKNIGTTKFYAQIATPKEWVTQAIGEYLKNPSFLGRSKSFVYINMREFNEQYHYFVCRAPLEQPNPDCNTYALEIEPTK